MEHVRSSLPGSGRFEGLPEMTADIWAETGGLCCANTPQQNDSVIPQWWSHPSSTRSDGDPAMSVDGGFFGVISGAISDLATLIDALRASLRSMLGEAQAEGNPIHIWPKPAPASTGTETPTISSCTSRA